MHRARTSTWSSHEIPDPLTEYDIEKDAQARREYDALGARGVPVILVGKKRMNGFSAAGFEKLYR